MEQPAEEIRAAGHRYVQRARGEGQDTVTILAGDIVRELRLTYRVPSVCSALASKRFQRENGITLERREGPPSGIGTSSRFTYRMNEAVASAKAPESTLWALRGAGKDVFKALGGGEAFLTKERQELNQP
jgi:hypothetical protein